MERKVIWHRCTATASGRQAEISNSTLVVKAEVEGCKLAAETEGSVPAANIVTSGLLAETFGPMSQQKLLLPLFPLSN